MWEIVQAWEYSGYHWVWGTLENPLSQIWALDPDKRPLRWSCHREEGGETGFPIYISVSLSILTSFPLWEVFVSFYLPCFSMECGQAHSCLPGQFGDSLDWWVHSTLELVGRFLPCSVPGCSQLGSCLSCCMTLNLWLLMSLMRILTGQGSLIIVRIK